jgi:uncharacterized protein YjiS (DUF1127 family)
MKILMASTPATGHAIERIRARRAISLRAMVLRAVRRIRGMVATWYQRNEERNELARMSEFELRDIGFSRSDVWYEVRKQFWQD